MSFARRHWLFGALLACGAALRLVTSLAYQPAFIIDDSQGYLWDAERLTPDEVRPLGYGVFLRLVGAEHGLELVAAAQHLLGLAIAVLIYVLLLRLGVPRWASALAAAPVLLDSHQLIFEQHVLVESLFELLVVAGCVVLVWLRRPGALQAAVAGLLLAAAALTRANGIVVLAPALLTLLCLTWSRPGGRWRPALPVAGALLLAFAAPVAGYAIWFNHAHGSYAISNQGGRFLYGRVSPFADCSRYRVPADERVLCPVEPVGERPTLAGSTAEHYVWGAESPIWRVHPDQRAALGGRLARRVIRHQPLDYLQAVGRDFVRGFALTRSSRPGELTIDRWRFPQRYPVYLADTDAILRRHGDGRARVDEGLARFLRGYQHVGFTPGPVLALGLLAGLLAGLGLGAARHSPLRWPAFLFAATGLVVFASTVVVNQFSWRYQLPLVVLLPPAAALGITALRRSAATRAEG